MLPLHYHLIGSLYHGNRSSRSAYILLDDIFAKERRFSFLDDKNKLMYNYEKKFERIAALAVHKAVFFVFEYIFALMSTLPDVHPSSEPLKEQVP